MLRPMIVWAVAVDSLTKSPVVILKEDGGTKTLPIWIGIREGIAIASELQGLKLSRPMTHDLLKIILDLTGAKVRKVEVSDLRNHTYYALIHIIHKGKNITLDARPSDAVALSLRIGAPIFVSEQVINGSKKVYLKAESKEEPKQEENWQGILEKLNPEDFGNT